MSAYAELAVTTNFSFLRGASHPEELVAQAKALGLAGLGIADRNSVAGVVRAHEAAKEHGLRLAVGARLVFADATPDILAYPQDRAGWARLTRLLTLGKRRAEKGACTLFFEDLLAHCAGLNLIVLAEPPSLARKARENRHFNLPPPLRRSPDRAAIQEGGALAVLAQNSTPLPNPPPTPNPSPQGGGEQSEQPRLFPSPLAGEDGETCNEPRVMREPDPRIHGVTPQARRSGVDGLVKPGHDEEPKFGGDGGDEPGHDDEDGAKRRQHTPSPLAGEGGETEPSEVEPGEGESSKHSARSKPPHPPRSPAFARRPLPQGEREENAPGEGESREHSASLTPPHPPRSLAFARRPLPPGERAGSAGGERASSAGGERDRQTEPLPVLGLLSRLREAAPGAVWVGARMLYRGDDARRLARLAALAAEAKLPLIAVGDVLYHAPERRPLQDVVTCIREHLALDSAGRRLQANAERHLKSAQEMARLFRAAPQAVAETLRFLDRCRFSLDELAYEYPDEIREGFASPQDALIAFAEEGARQRYPDGVPAKVRHALDHEYALIGELNYAPYFLTVHDIVRFARGEGILCQGRGSAANSAVCYCLGVTEVDPARADLLFERFVSAERREPPDIDVDFEHERREEAIQYVYRRYGRARAGLAATVICYRGRSAIREVGKAFGLSEDTIGALAGTLWGWSPEAISYEHARRAGFDPADSRLAKALALARELIGFPRHLSQHVGGFVITCGRLDELVPIENAAMEERTVIEWDKDDLDTLRILKIDVLALGMLSCLRRALDFLQKHYSDFSFTSPLEGEVDQGRLAGVDREGGETGLGEGRSAARKTSPLPNPPPQGGREQSECVEREKHGLQRRAERLDLSVIPPEDEAVYRMLARADSVGVFQVESRAQMTMLPRLRPREFYDLVIEVAIVRPGPIQGDMVHPYLRRRQGLEQVHYPSPAPAHGLADELRQVLGKTLGVPLFQEQAMRIAIVAAGFTPSEADQLRRAMATFRRVGTIKYFRSKLIEGMAARGYPRDFAERCFNQIEGFGEYGFPESHAASFALLVYASAWIKCRYPDVFAASLLNSQPMGFYAPAQIVRDAQEHGVAVRPVDVNFSDWDCTLEARDCTLEEGSQFELASPLAGEADQGRRAGIDRERGNIDGGQDRCEPGEGEAPCSLSPCGSGRGVVTHEDGGSSARALRSSASSLESAPAPNPSPQGGGEQSEQPPLFPSLRAGAGGESSRAGAGGEEFPLPNPPPLAGEGGARSATGGGMQSAYSRSAPPHPPRSPGAAPRERGALSRKGRGHTKQRIHPRHADMADDVRATHALRLGLRQISGFAEADARAIERARGAGFDSIRDLWLRTKLSPAALERLAQADAFRSLGLDRRKALWAVRALRRAGDKDDLPLFARVQTPELEPDVALPPMRLGEHVVADYRHLRLSLKAHPASFLRSDFDRRGILRNEQLAALPSGRRVSVAGVVLVRQRPGTAKGVIFMTLEDETGVANAIVWPQVFESFRPIVLGARLVGVSGRLQNESGVIHVVAERLDDLTPLLRRLASDSGCIEALARCDEVKRPIPENRIPPRAASALAALLREEPALGDELASAAAARTALPKGRNFH